MNKEIKILQVNTFAEGGGAARALARLRKSFRGAGMETNLLVAYQGGHPEAGIIKRQPVLGETFADLRRHLDALPVRFTPKQPITSFAPAIVPDLFYRQIDRQKPDLVHLHWLGAGFCRLESLARINRPLVWTLHDMWAFTGGCYYAGDCTAYEEKCGKCPQLGSNRDVDLSRKVWQRKANSWENLDLTVVTPSRWMAKCAGKSSLFKNRRIEVIPNAIEKNIFKPDDSRNCRSYFKLPENKKYILFGAINATSDERKGFAHLQKAMDILHKKGLGDSVELLVYGASEPAAPPDLGLKTRFMGYINDDITLARLYSAADLVVVPSLEDNLPNVIVEALACGTPCCAFNIGGMPDMIDHMKNGYLAEPFKAGCLAEGIEWILQYKESDGTLRKNARMKAEQNFTLEKIAHRHLELYRDVLKTQVLNGKALK